MAIPLDWSGQKIAEFLAAVSSFATAPAAAAGAVERVAESLDAEVVAIVSRGTALAVIGYPEGGVPVGELVAVATGRRTELTVPGSGSCPATVVPLEHPVGSRLVVARSGPDALSVDEVGLLHAMARVSSMALRMLSLLDEERALRTESQRQSAENARLLATLTEHQELLERLAVEQAALRRVATLVAKGERPEVIFARVAHEIARISNVEHGFVVRFEDDATLTIVAKSGSTGMPMPVGSRWPLDGDSVAARVYRTGRPAHVDDYRDLTGTIAAAMPSVEFSSVGAPIVIGERLWGAATATSVPQPGASAAEAEERVAQFADLIAIAISNADARAQLTASRARVVAAADEARRRLERNLHDGIQQGLVSLALGLREAESMAPADPPELPVVISRLVDGLSGVMDELREISRGLHPAMLSEGGLEFALRSLARRSAVPATLTVRVTRRLPQRVEVPAYYVVSEALTNVVKHARASGVDIDVDATNGVVRVSVRDDGVGGADVRRGSGLIGLVDRVEAAGGAFTISSPPGKGTAVLATFVLGDEVGADVVSR
jgi:signal transduction histidine kinase